RQVDPQPAHQEDEQVHRVGHQQQARDDLEGPRSQDQPDTRAEQDADADRDHRFHQAASAGWVDSFGSAPVPGTGATGALWLRTDWGARATSSSIVAPTTTRNTPRSNAAALGTWTSPSSGMCRCTVWLVRKGYPKSQAAAPVAPAISSPVPSQRWGQSLR